MIRYVIVNVMRYEPTVRVMTYPPSPWNIHETRDHAQKNIDMFRTDLVAQLGAERANSLEVLAVECREGTNYPKVTVFGPDYKEPVDADV
jgi:hypothetical protein